MDNEEMISQDLCRMNPYGGIKSEWASEFSNIEFEIDLAEKGRPVRDSES